jgi:hypothetical protein
MAFCWRLRPFPFALLILAGGCQPPHEQGDEQVSATSSAVAQTTASSSTELTCSDPVRPTDTAASLQQRYGDRASVETLYGPEGIQFPGLVLWPEDAARRLEVVFREEGTPTVSSVRLGEASTWRVAGLAIGDPLARANAANGKPFKLWGFGWDYGGTVSDLAGGRLATQPGGCRVVMALGPREDVALPEGLVGDLELSSDDPRLATVGVVIHDLSLAF